MDFYSLSTTCESNFIDMSSYDSQEIDEFSIASLDKKNVVRNLIRALLKYIFNKNNKATIYEKYFADQSEYEVKYSIKRYFGKKKYNNLMIKQIFKHQIYGSILKEFLQNEAMSYLEKSSVKEKENHTIFVKFLMRCFDDESLLDNLETYSKFKKI